MLMGGEFNVPLEAMDRPNNAGGQNLDSKDSGPARQETRRRPYKRREDRVGRGRGKTD